MMLAVAHCNSRPAQEDGDVTMAQKVLELVNIKLEEAVSTLFVLSFSPSFFLSFSLSLFLSFLFTLIHFCLFFVYFV